MIPTIVPQYAPPSSYRAYPGRPITHIVAHHSADVVDQNHPAPKAGASWHRWFKAGHVILHAVPDDCAAHAVLKHDLMPNHPSILRCPDGAVSDSNYCGLQYELEYAPQPPYNQIPRQDQVEDFVWQVRQDYRLYGAIPVLPHGIIQSDKWDTEPHGFPWDDHFTWVPGLGYFLPVGEETDVLNPVSDEHIKGWLEALGVGVNMDTAIMQFAAEAYRNGHPPHGNWRGPALYAPYARYGQSGEYQITNEDGHLCIRHRFSAGIAEFNTVTGGLSWVEVVQYPDQITTQD